MFSGDYPLQLFFEQLERVGFEIGIRDYQRFISVLRTDGQWTLIRLERVLASLLVRDPQDRLKFQHEFHSFFNTRVPENQIVVDIEIGRWRSDIERLLSDAHLLINEKSTNKKLVNKKKGSKHTREATGKRTDEAAQKPRVKKRFWLKIFSLVLVLFIVVIGTGTVLETFFPDPPVEPIPQLNPSPSPDVNPSLKQTQERTHPSNANKPPISDWITIQIPQKQAPIKIEPPEDRRFMPGLWWPIAVLALAIGLGLLFLLLTRMRPVSVREKVLCFPDLPEQYFNDNTVGEKPAPWLTEKDADDLTNLLQFMTIDKNTRELDIETSIAETSKSGTLPVLRFKKKRTLQKVLILTDHIIPKHPWYQFPDEVALALQARGVPLTFGRFNGTPNRFIDQEGQAHRIEEWEGDRHNLLLLIFADAHKTAGLQKFPWHNWPEARVLTRRERRNWDFCEQLLLQQHVTLLPADREGLYQAWCDLTSESRVLSRSVQKSVPMWDVTGRKPHETTQAYLQRILGKALPWAQSLALYPGPWSLSAAEQLRAHFYKTVPRLALQRLFSLTDVVVSANSAKFKTTIRAALKAGFDRQCLTDRKAVIELWLAMMRAKEPQKGSQAWAIWRWKYLTLEWNLQPDECAQAMHALMVSSEALRAAIQCEIEQCYDTGQLTLPKTRKGQRHLAALSESYRVNSRLYDTAPQYRKGCIIAFSIAVLCSGLIVRNGLKGTPTLLPMGPKIEKKIPIPHVVTIEGGTFNRGCGSEQGCDDEDEKPVYAVTVNSFEMAVYEVTVAQFSAFIEASGYQTIAEKEGSCWIWNGDSGAWKKGTFWRQPGYVNRDNYPVTCISWEDAQAYLKWLSQQTQHVWRLPTEAEWEYAARAGSETRFSWGNQDPVCDRKAQNGSQFGGCQEKLPVTVGSFPSNDWQLSDMHGNVWEWVEDCYVDNYNDAPRNSDSVQKCSNRAYRVLRGGSWGSEPGILRSSNRLADQTDSRNNYVGFRATRTL